MRNKCVIDIGRRVQLASCVSGHVLHHEDI